MIRLKHIRFVQILCLTAFFSLFYTSCSNNNTTIVQDGCSPPLGEALNNLNNMTTEQIADPVEQMFYYARTLERQEGYTTFGEYFEELYGGSASTNAHYLNLFEAESNKYTDLGFEGYVQSKAELSDALKDYFIAYSSELTNYLATAQPTLDEFKIFIAGKINSLASSDLCENDQQIMDFYLAASQGYAQYYYTIFDHPDSQTAQLNGCGFFQSLGCGLLALTVGVLTAGASFVLSLEGNIRINGQSAGQVNFDLAVLGSLALGAYAGVSVYEWCCNRGEVEPQNCLAPTGATYIQLDCNQFQYRIFGPSDYSETEWENDNTDPVNTITPKSILNFAVPDFGEISMMIAKVSCVKSGTDVDIFDWNKEELFEADEDYFPLTWSIAPPPYFTYQSGSGPQGGGIGFDNVINVSVNTAATALFSYEWTVNSPHEIITGGESNDNSAYIQINDSNTNLITTVTATNTCLNDTETISETIIIQ